MKIIKKIFNLLICVLTVIAILHYKEISNFIISNLIYNKNANIEIAKGEYSKEINYEFVQITNDFVAKDYQHLLNILYTILDSGNDTVYFYCSDEYKECLDTINTLIEDENNTILAELNNYVHPYYSYKNILIATNNFGKVTVTLEKQYTKEEIEYVNEQLDIISESVTKEKKDNKEKIKAIHDYIIENTKYDSERAENMDSLIYADSKTHTAYGLLKDKKSLCGGYSDLMSIYLYRLGINNIRISGNRHVWNLVNIDGWKHLDVTWDDPVTNTGEDILLHDYFLITTEELRKADSVEHQFNKNIYLEAN